MSNLVLGNPYTPVQCAAEEQQSHRSMRNVPLKVYADAPPPALLQIDGTDTRRERKLTAGLLKSVHPCTLFNDEFSLRKNIAAA